MATYKKGTVADVKRFSGNVPSGDVHVPENVSSSTCIPANSSDRTCSSRRSLPKVREQPPSRHKRLPKLESHFGVVCSPLLCSRCHVVLAWRLKSSVEECQRLQKRLKVCALSGATPGIPDSVNKPSDEHLGCHTKHFLFDLFLRSRVSRCAYQITCPPPGTVALEISLARGNGARVYLVLFDGVFIGRGHQTNATNSPRRHTDDQVPLRTFTSRGTVQRPSCERVTNDARPLSPFDSVVATYNSVVLNRAQLSLGCAAVNSPIRRPR